MLTKIEMLFIRACKSKNPSKRVQSVYRRFYLGWNEERKHDILYILLGICEEWCPIEARKLINDLSPEALRYSNTDDYWNRVLYIVIFHIRHTDVKIFDGIVRPAWSRNL